MGELNPFRDRVVSGMHRIHDGIRDMFERLDRGGRFREDRWEREGGGGGITRVLDEGETYEKAGVNMSVVHGSMDPCLASRLGAVLETLHDPTFFATGVSVVAHARSPMIPIVHLNVRYFEICDADGCVVDSWFGGGADLTPTYPFPEDATHFHTVLKDTCDRWDAGWYPRFKRWCDEYFVNTHRDGEARGVGGVFFDNLRALHGRDRGRVWGFVQSVGRVLESAYAPIVQLRRHTLYGDREREFQLYRRGRYVEFNLVHDRGTRFGLETSARADSVLMSLPPVARWSYAPRFEPDSFEARLTEMLTPREWASETPSWLPTAAVGGTAVRA